MGTVPPLAHDLERAQLVASRGGLGEGGMTQKEIAVLVDPVVGAEPEIRVLALGRGVDEAALVPGERTLLVVVADDVLAELGAERFEQVAKVADHRERAQDGVATLG